MAYITFADREFDAYLEHFEKIGYLKEFVAKLLEENSDTIPERESVAVSLTLDFDSFTNGNFERIPCSTIFSLSEPQKYRFYDAVNKEAEKQLKVKNAEVDFLQELRELMDKYRGKVNCVAYNETKNMLNKYY